MGMPINARPRLGLEAGVENAARKNANGFMGESFEIQTVLIRKSLRRVPATR
jgi:hypothetical protein